MSDYINIALASMGAVIVEQSSCTDSVLHSSANVLKDDQKDLWVTGDGLPQYIVISLENISSTYLHLNVVGFYCWHDYSTNPKSIELWAAPSTDSDYIHWENFQLKRQSGSQFFDIRPLPSNYRLLKIIITQTFGDFQTYLNQIFLMAEPEHSLFQHKLELEDLESQIKSKQFKKEYFSPLKRFKKNQGDNHSGKKQKKITEKNQFNFTEEQNMSQNYMKEDTFNNKLYKRQAKKDERVEQNEELQNQFYEEEDESSLNKNIAMLTLSKHVIEMEQNIDEIERKVNVLDMKITISHQTLEKQILDKVQALLDKRLQSKYSQKTIGKPQDLSETNSPIQRTKQDFYRHAKPIKPSEDSETKIINKRTNQVSHTTNSNGVITQTTQKDRLILDLMEKLAKKLKERDVKIKKMEQKKTRRRHKDDLFE